MRDEGFAFLWVFSRACVDSGKRELPCARPAAGKQSPQLQNPWKHPMSDTPNTRGFSGSGKIRRRENPSALQAGGSCRSRAGSPGDGVKFSPAARCWALELWLNQR